MENFAKMPICYCAIAELVTGEINFKISNET